MISERSSQSAWWRIHMADWNTKLNRSFWKKDQVNTITITLSDNFRYLPDVEGMGEEEREKEN